MKYLALPFCALMACLALADHKDAGNKPIVLLPGLGPVHHPVTTASKEAQQFFDQGLALIYAFNHEEAVRSFRRAAELDPKLAMAHWGIALALGPNYNLDADSEQAKAAYAAVQQALKLAADSQPAERAYIQAVARRYAADPKADRKQLATDYKNAMRDLMQAYPDDLDAATLYAESMMNLRPWELWSKDGKPAEDTDEIITVLESVLRRNPDHTGANHYYIHAVEASLTPERGLAAAYRLDTLAPGAGHLVHMPSHIYYRVGDYAAAARSNAAAARVDREYIKAHQVKGVYPMMYYSHNLHFLAVAHAMQGRFTDAKQAADDLEAHVRPHVKAMPMLEGFLPTPTLVLVRFRRWQEVMSLPEPEANLLLVRSLRHFARGLALASTSKAEQADKEMQAFRSLRQGIAPDMPYGDRNKAQAVLGIAEEMLAARMAAARKDYAVAVKHLHKAAEAEDALNYIEPPDWYLHARETLGGVYLAAGQAEAAERVFREDLKRNPRSGRSLFGLREALTAQKKDAAAQLVDLQYKAAWKNAAPAELRIEDL